MAVSRSGEISVIDDLGRERERYKLPYGAVLRVKDHDEVTAGAIVANWDPHTHPIITEVAGTLRFVDFVEGVTVQKQTDDVTGLSSVVVLDPKQRPASGKDLREHQLVVDEIVRRLRPLCERLELPARPRVRELRDVLHLLTPIAGTLAAPRHVLELVEEPLPGIAMDRSTTVLLLSTEGITDEDNYRRVCEKIDLEV